MERSLTSNSSTNRLSESAHTQVKCYILAGAVSSGTGGRTYFRSKVLFRPPDQLTLFLCSDSLLTSRFKVSPAKNEQMTYTYTNIYIEVFRPRYGVTHTDMQMPGCNSYTSVQLHVLGDSVFIAILSFRQYKNSLQKLTSLFTIVTQFPP